MNKLLMFLLTLSCAALLAGAARADPYWISYEGNDFPENEGWTRVYGDENGHGQGGAERWIEDGNLVIDGRRDIAIYDSYTMSRSVNPGPGETFIMHWRLKVEEVSAYQDPSLVVFSDDSWAVAFNYAESYLRSSFDEGVIIPFESGLYHEYEFRSTDMRTYELFIDDSLAHQGVFSDVISSSEVSWGDGWQGSASLARWDYFEFGVVPEPCNIVGIGLLCAVHCASRK